MLRCRGEHGSPNQRFDTATYPGSMQTVTGWVSSVPTEPTVRRRKQASSVCATTFLLLSLTASAPCLTSWYVIRKRSQRLCSTVQVSNGANSSVERGSENRILALRSLSINAFPLCLSKKATAGRVLRPRQDPDKFTLLLIESVTLFQGCNLTQCWLQRSWEPVCVPRGFSVWSPKRGCETVGTTC